MKRSFVSFALAFAMLPALAGVAAAADGPTMGLRYPSLTPDGKTVVFGYRGDLWAAPVDGKGQALRLTIHDAQETLARVSPDGTQVAFSSLRNGNYDLYVMPITGGEPKQLTFHSAVEILCDWSPDGTRLLFTSNRDGELHGLDLYEVSVDGGSPRRITRDGGRDGSYSPDGKRVVYIRGFVDLYWDNYSGSSNYDLYVVPVSGGTPEQITDTAGNERWPFYSPDGATIYFTAEEEGVANFYAMPAAGGARKKLTALKGDDVLRPHLAADRKTAVFERGGRLYTVDLSAAKAAPKEIPLTIRSDVRSSGVERRTITGGGEQVDVSNDGTQAVFTRRGDLWLMPASGGPGRRLTSGPANDQWPRFSPDGRKIAYFSNATGNEDLHLLDLTNGQTKQLTRNPANDFFHGWSPDGRTIVFTSERSGNRDLWTIDVETGVETQLTADAAADDDASFSRDGRFIAFDSGRGGGQSIWIMNADGSNPRRVTTDNGTYQVPTFSPDGRMVVYEAFQPMGGSGGLYVSWSSGGPGARISPDGSAARWSADGQWIYFHADRGGGQQIYRIRAPERVELGEVVPFYGTEEVDVRAELASLFDEAWNALRQGFYDPKMHGLDWGAIQGRYRAMAIDTQNKAEFQNVIRQMLAELGASHLGIGGGEEPGSSVPPDVPQNGLLGLDFETVPAEDGARRIAAVTPGGPADQAGLRVGDVITRIGRTKLGADANLDRLTAGTVGQAISIGFRPFSESGLGDERSVELTPISIQQISNLRYRNWENGNAKTVREATSSKDSEIAYIHLSQMNGPNLAKFQQAVQRWASQPRMKGMILDVRNNGGGNIHGQLIEILTAKPLAMVQRRGGPKTPQPAIYWDRPVVVLVNERSFSDAEVFPWMFRAVDRGPIVGVPTAGGVIGTQNITLSDGSMFRIPTVGFWGMDGTPLEGLGVKPDVLVEETPADRAAGRDPQLAKAIELILAEVRGGPAEPVKPEERPDVGPSPIPPAPEAAVPPAGEQPAEADRKLLADAVVGEWVRFRLYRGEEEPILVTAKVSSLADGVVHITVESAGEVPQMPPLPTELPVGADVVEEIGKIGKVTAVRALDGAAPGGKTRKLLQVDADWADGSRLTFTFTKEVPVYGLLQVEMGNVMVMEAVEWLSVEAPAAEPAPGEPAAPAEEATADAPPPHPVHDAAVGEWIRIRRLMRGRPVEVVMTVKEVSETVVLISQQADAGGRLVAGPDLPRPRDQHLVPPEGFTLVGYGRETLTVKEEAIDCIVMTATDAEGVEWKWWASPSIPVNGYVRVTMGGEEQVTLLDWGFPATR